MAYVVQAAPAQYTGYVYTAQAPAYVVQQQPVAPAQPSMAQQMAAKAAKATAVAAGKVLDASIKTAGEVINHVGAAGICNSMDVASSKASYVTQMLSSGGPTPYWKKQFDPPAWEKLVETYACFLKGDRGVLVPGVMFIGTGSVSFCSDEPVYSPQGYLYHKFRLPIELVHSFQPAKTEGKDFVGVIMLDQFQFWFSGFMNYQRTLEALNKAAREYQASR